MFALFCINDELMSNWPAYPATTASRTAGRTSRTAGRTCGWSVGSGRRTIRATVAIIIISCKNLLQRIAQTI